MTPVQFARVTVAVDGSPTSDHALDVAIDLAKRYGSELALVAVVPLAPLSVPGSETFIPVSVSDSELQYYRGVVNSGVARAEAAGLSAVTGVALEGIVTDEIIAHLEQHLPDLLVIGSRGLSGAKRLLLGSVSTAVLHHVQCPVLVVREAAKPATAPP